MIDLKNELITSAEHYASLYLDGFHGSLSTTGLRTSFDDMYDLFNGSMRVHSTYWRTFKDLPWQDRAVTWRVKVRRFRCSCCSDRTFAERVPGFAGAKARRSDRLAAAQCDIGLVLGGEAGARLSRRLAMPVSGETVPCPSCGRSSTRVHSTYWRTLKDLPWQDRAVTWHIKVRRFRCSHCPGRVFAERVPGFSARKALRSDRLAAAQTDIGLVLGGEPGARLSRRLAMPVSGDTVLRLIRQREIEPCSPPRVVGIDDWAWRRGRFYGTIVCDLERRRVIDLLPGRSAGPVRDWLAAHPTVRVISRDRSGPYAEAARTGAPTATQVADRWHLLVNASDVLRRIVERHQAEIRHAARQCVPDPSVPTGSTPTAPVPERSERRHARCEAALRLHGEGVPIKDIARRLSASRNGVRRWVRAGHFVNQ